MCSSGQLRAYCRGYHQYTPAWQDGKTAQHKAALPAVRIVVIPMILRTRRRVRSEIACWWWRVTGRTVVMSTAICAIWLLASVPGAEPPGVAYAVGPVVDLTSEHEVSAGEPLLPGTDGVGTPLGMVHVCRRPEPLLYIDTNCSMRLYTILNAGYHKQPYDHLVRFDYPWHRRASCSGCKGIHKWPDPRSRLHAALAPLARPVGTREGGTKSTRPSAIRQVD
jgi:hypothetical protein